MLRNIYRVSEKSPHTQIFIYLIVPAFYVFSGSVLGTLTVAQSLMRRQVLCGFFRDIYVVKEAKVLVMATICGQIS